MARKRRANKSVERGGSETLPKPPDFASDEEEAAWLESEEGRRFLEQAPLRPIRFVPKDPSLIPITMRLPKGLRDRMRRLAAERGMGYQTLARQWLLERCRDEEQNETARGSNKKGKRSA